MRYASILLWLVTSTAGAANWQQIGDPDPNGGVVLVDAADITDVKGYRRAWLKSVYTSNQPIPDEYRRGGARTYRRLDELSIFNCSARTSAAVEFHWHGADGIRVADFRNEQLKFRPVPPASREEQVLETVCTAELAKERVPSEEQPKMTRPVNPIDYYPAGSIRRNEQGEPMVRVCVDQNGKLLRAPEIVESSGFPELDGAGIEVARTSRYFAGTKDGIALPESCLEFKVTFRLASGRRKPLD